jgi:hypothetical protein
VLGAWNDPEGFEHEIRALGIDKSKGQVTKAASASGVPPRFGTAEPGPTSRNRPRRAPP